MKKSILLIFMSALSVNAFAQANWEDRYDEVRVIYGTVVSDDDDIIYNKGYAIVSKNGKYGIANLEKEMEIVVPQFDSIKSGGEHDRLRVLSGEKWGVINFKTGEIVIPVKYSSIGNIDPPKPIIVTSDNKYGLVGHDGSVILEPVYALITEEGRFVMNNKYGLLNSEGKVIAEPVYTFITPGLVFILNGKMGYLNRDGSIALPNIYDKASAFENGRATVVLDGKTMVIGWDGKEFTGKLVVLDKAEIKVGQKKVDTIVENTFRLRNDSNRDAVIVSCYGPHPRTTVSASLKTVKQGETVEVNVKFPVFVGPFFKKAAVEIDTGETIWLIVSGEGMP